MNAKDRTRFNTEDKPTWCPGCGNFGIQAALKKAFGDLGLEPHEVALSSGIGCSGKMPHWLDVFGLHGLHGRALPAAAGMKLANHSLTVIAEGGDGDGYSEGAAHFLAAARRNLDFTYVVHNNGVFGLTTGQVSPTGALGFKGSTTPGGSLEPPMSPLAVAIAAGAGYVARGFSGDIEHLASLIVGGVQHRGFAFVDVLQVCVSFNPSKSFAWYRDRVFRLEDESHDPSDRGKAMALALEDSERIPTGLFYRVEGPSYEDGLPQLAAGPLATRPDVAVDVTGLLREFI